MKNTLLQIKKIFCLILSIFFISSNSVIFAQNMNATIHIPSGLKDDIVKTNLSLYEAQSAFDELLKAIDGKSSNVPELLAKYKEKAEIAAQNYFDYTTNLRSFERYIDDIQDVGVLKRLANQYSSKKKQIPTLHNLKDNLIITHFRNEVAQLSESNISALSRQNLHEIHRHLISTFEDDLLLDFSKLHVSVDKLNRTTEKMIKLYVQPQDVLLAAYTDLSANGKIAFRANLQLREHPEKLAPVIRDIRRYLKKTNLTGQTNFSFFRLLRELRGMNMAERERYVAFLTDLKPEQKQLLKDIGTIPEKSARQLTVKKMLRAGPMLIIGTILVATTISEVSANNSFSKNSISASTLSGTYKNIKEGDVSLTEAMTFYTNPANEGLIMKDIDHTINLYALALAKSAADDDLDIITDIIDNDPELKVTANKNEKVSQTIMQNLGQVISKNKLSL